MPGPEIQAKNTVRPLRELPRRLRTRQWCGAVEEHVVDQVDKIGDVDHLRPGGVGIRLLATVWLRPSLEHVVDKIDQIGDIQHW